MRRLVEEHLEHLLRFEVQRLAGEQHLAADLAVGDPAAAPPVAELHEPTALDTGAEDDDDLGELGVAAADVGPGRLAGDDELAGGRSGRGLGVSTGSRVTAVGAVLVDDGERGLVRLDAEHLLRRRGTGWP